MEGGKTRVVVDSLVPGAETLAVAGSGLQPTVGVVLVLCQQFTGVNLDNKISGEADQSIRKYPDNYN